MANLLELLVAGQGDPRLGLGAQRRVTGNALVDAGVAGLLAGAEGTRLPGVLGQLIGTGRESAQSQAQAMVEDQRAQEKHEQDLMHSTQVITKPDGSMVLVDLITGEEIATIHDGSGDTKLGSPSMYRLGATGDMVLGFPDTKHGVIRGVDGNILINPEKLHQLEAKDTGNGTWAWFDPYTGEQVGPELRGETPAWLGRYANAKSKSGSDLSTEAMIGMGLDSELDRMIRILAPRDYEMFGPVETFIQSGTDEGVGGLFYDVARSVHAMIQPGRTEQIQILADASGSVVTSVVRMREGGRPSDKDREFFKAFIAPRPGDNPNTVREKLKRVRLIAALNKAGQGDIAFDQVWAMIPPDLKAKGVDEQGRRITNGGHSVGPPDYYDANGNLVRRGGFSSSDAGPVDEMDDPFGDIPVGE